MTVHEKPTSVRHSSRFQVDLRGDRIATNTVTQPQEPDGPHQLPYHDQERCTVEGRYVEGGYVYTVLAIRDRKRRGWVLYSRGAVRVALTTPTCAFSGLSVLTGA